MFRIFKYIPQVWGQAFSSRGFRNQLVITVLVFVAVMMHHVHYLRLWQDRHGIYINDIILNQLRPHDFSPLIFGLEYATLLLVFLFTIPFPDRFVKGLQMFALMFLARTMAIYLFPLEPPKDMAPLFDPLANLVLHSKEVFVTKDLFFSGHIAALTLLMLISANKYVKRWVLIATLMVGILLMWQHVHYSLDVIFAPVVSFVSYKFVLFIHRETRYDPAWSKQEVS